jgi:hypothetical protein
MKTKNKPGQGRPLISTPRKMYSLRLPIELMDSIAGNKTEFLINAVTAALENKK